MKLYLVTNRINGKRYVGQTVQPLAKRWGQHKADATRGSLCRLHIAMRKYGFSNFSIQELETDPIASHDALNAAEKEAIARLGTLIPHGYNMSVGGDSPLMTPQKKARIAAGVRRAWQDAQFKARQSVAIKAAWAIKSPPELRKQPIPLAQFRARAAYRFVSPAMRAQMNADIAALFSE